MRTLLTSVPPARSSGCAAAGSYACSTYMPPPASVTSLHYYCCCAVRAVQQLRRPQHRRGVRQWLGPQAAAGGAVPGSARAHGLRHGPNRGAAHAHRHAAHRVHGQRVPEGAGGLRPAQRRPGAQGRREGGTATDKGKLFVLSPCLACFAPAHRPAGSLFHTVLEGPAAERMLAVGACRPRPVRSSTCAPVHGLAGLAL